MRFLGRKRELATLRKVGQCRNGASLTVVYGRRRVGKTRLVEEAFKEGVLLTFEGVEGYTSQEQRTVFLSRLAQISGRTEYTLINNRKWTDVLTACVEYIAQTYGREPVTILFDEFQWMAAGQKKLVSALKYVWDLHFKKRTNVHLVLCGSVGSFLVKKVLRSRALYGRVTAEINLQPLRLDEISDVFIPKRSFREIVELYMSIGGIPQYLEFVDPKISTRLNLERLCFSHDGYLVSEFERIFVSHFGHVPHYRTIVKHLAERGYADRQQLLSACAIDSGGTLSTYLEDLELAGFIERYASIDRPEKVRNNRFRLRDHYIDFFLRFIQPSLKKIRSTSTRARFSTFVPDKRYTVWSGLAFERLCRFHHELIAKALGFQSVDYECGSWYSSRGKHSAQVDLLFKRSDNVLTLCELKFRTNKIGCAVIDTVEKKIQQLAKLQKKTIEKVLISASESTSDLVQEEYFNQILNLSDLFPK